MSSSDASTEAIVLSGGGSYGAYEVGIVKALFTGASPATDFKPLNADMFVGTSAGAINAAVLVSHLSAGPSAAVQYLEHLWSNVIAEQPGGCGNGVYRVRTPLEFLDPDCLIMNPLQSLLDIASDTNFFTRDWFNRAIMFARSRESLVRRTLQLVDLSTLVSTDPLHQRLAEAVPLEGLRQSDKILRVVTTNFTTGALQIFTNEDIVERVGYKAILASAAIPGFFPPVDINGELYVDGGTLMNTPIGPAIAGASTLHVVYMDPDVQNIPDERLRDTIDALDRTIVIALAYAINQQIEVARDINQTLELLEQVDDSRDLSDVELRSFLRVASRIKRRIQTSSPYKKLTIHRYHPHEDLGGVLGLMNLGYDRIRGLIDRGFNDAARHNCTVSDCVLLRQSTLVETASVREQDQRADG
jgi:predicted acylesterase/phospholipase RssA